MSPLFCYFSCLLFSVSHPCYLSRAAANAMLAGIGDAKGGLKKTATKSVSGF